MLGKPQAGATVKSRRRSENLFAVAFHLIMICTHVSAHGHSIYIGKYALRKFSDSFGGRRFF